MFMLHIAKSGSYVNVQWINLLLSARSLLDKNQGKLEERDYFASLNSEKEKFNSILSAKQIFFLSTK